MSDDYFANVAAWWDRGALLIEKRAVASLMGSHVDLAEVPWASLPGDVRWRLVNAMRHLVRLGDELAGVLS